MSSTDFELVDLQALALVLVLVEMESFEMIDSVILFYV
jgi:hypothetical protein